MLVVASFLWTVCFTLAYIANVDAAPRAIGGFFKQVNQYNDMDKDEQGEYQLFHMSFAGLCVNEEIRAAYPLLTQTIEKINQKEWQYAQRTRARMKKEAAEMTIEEFREFIKTIDEDTVVSVTIVKEEAADGRE